MPTELVRALRTLLRECKNGYAKTYAAALLRDGNWMTQEERRHQILYILSNTSGWRGDVARDVKAQLRSY